MKILRCLRCKGYMIREKFTDILDDTGKLGFYGWRCVSCGEVSDPVIQANRKEQIRPLVSRKRKLVVAIN